MPLVPDGARPRPGAFRIRLLADADQFDFEREVAVRRDRADGAIAISRRGRAGQLRLAADLHLLHPLRPAGNHAIERKDCRAAMLVGAVEFGAVRERAAIVHAHDVGGGGLRAGALLDVLDYDARRQLIDGVGGERARCKGGSGDQGNQ